MFVFESFFGNIKVRSRNTLVYEERIQFFIVFDVFCFLTVFNFVERRLSNKYMPSFDQFRHLAVEKRQQQGTNVRTVHVGIRHDNDTVITQLVQIKFVSDTRAQGGD